MSKKLTITVTKEFHLDGLNDDLTESELQEFVRQFASNVVMDADLNEIQDDMDITLGDPFITETIETACVYQY